MTRTPLEMLTAFAQNVLNPEMYGYAVTAEVRDAARKALGREAGEIENFKEVADARRTMAGIAAKVMEHISNGFPADVKLEQGLDSIFEFGNKSYDLKGWTITLSNRRWKKDAPK